CMKIFHHTFTYGSLAALIQLVGRIQAPIANAVDLVSQVYGVVASAERLQEVIGLPDEDQGTKLESFDAIKIEDVSFHYDDGTDSVLVDVNATIKRGDFVALTGISGGGKTSLFQLLLGIYKPKSGAVLFQQGDLSVPASRGTRSLFAYVPQGNTLMSGTMRDNLTMFTDYASDEDIRGAIHAACLDDLVAEVGLDVVLGERGVGLSEGQAQRVAVARALLSKAPILLLDESTSALDEQTEATLLKNISAMRDKTCIIVTHRRAALEICDYTLNIERGHMTRLENTGS
ncbi:MAG: ATP-binding cassette domain-containing protein, partial [Clostridia bacterium]|nr:ATP-binding cassette domain-containing protein [Clostridia bacterium]